MLRQQLKPVPTLTLQVTDRDRQLINIANVHAEEIARTAHLIKGAYAVLKTMKPTDQEEKAVFILPPALGIKCYIPSGFPFEDVILLASIVTGRILKTEPTASDDDEGLSEEQIDEKMPGRSGVYMLLGDLEQGVPLKHRLGRSFVILANNCANVMRREAGLPTVQNAWRIIDEVGNAFMARRIASTIEYGPTDDATTPTRLVTIAPKGWRCPAGENAREQFMDHVRNGLRLARQVTFNDDAAENYCRSLVYPILRRFMEKTFTFSGSGSNGKGTTARALAWVLPPAVRTKWIRSIKIDALATGDYRAEKAAKAFEGSIYVFDFDAGEIGTRASEALKSPAVGEPVTAGDVGTTRSDVEARGTIFTLTNKPFDTVNEDSMNRRIVNVPFSDNNSRKEMAEWRRQMRTGGILDVMLAGVWLEDRVDPDDPDEGWHRISIVREDQISPEELDYAKIIVDNGWAPSGPNILNSAPKGLNRNQTARMGLKVDTNKRRTVRLANGQTDRRRALVVVDETKFAPYRALAKKIVDDDGTSAVTPATPPSTIIAESRKAWTAAVNAAGKES